MADLQLVNKARELQGLPPLEKLATDTAPIEKKEDKPELNEDGTPKATVVEKKEPVVGELTDEQLIELLGKRGITAKSLEELKPKETQKTPEEIAADKETAKLTYGLSKGLFKKTEYENFIADNNAKQNLVFSQFALEAKAEDPTLTDEEIMGEFKEKYGLDAEAGTRKHKRGAKEIEVIGNEILKSKYNKIYDADQKFSAYEQEQETTATYNKNILAKTPEYKKNIDEAFDAVKNINGVDLPDEAVTELKNRFLDTKFVENEISSGFTKEQIFNQVRAAAVTKNIDYIIEKRVEKALLEKQAGVRGIIPPSDKKKEIIPTKELTENQKKAYAEYQKAFPAEKVEQN